MAWSGMSLFCHRISDLLRASNAGVVSGASGGDPPREGGTGLGGFAGGSMADFAYEFEGIEGFVAARAFFADCGVVECAGLFVFPVVFF